MTHADRSLRENPVAVIGLGALMPAARNLAAFWDNIVGNVDCITDVPASRWKIDDYYDPDPTAEDKTYCKRGGFLPDVDFDPLEFGLPPNLLEVTDVSQLLALLVAKEALADAGYLNSVDTLRERTGVILGVCGGQKLINPLTARLQYPVWDAVLRSSGVGEAERAAIIERMKLAYVRWEENSFPGLLGNVVSGRIANRFDLGGTNCVVDAACASTMAALKMTLSDLTEGRADMMLTGGVDTDNSFFTYLCFSKTPAFSKGSHPRPFDIDSDGMMVGEGIGMMVLKRLADAERDGDRIYAVIRGLGSSSDGRFKSIYAPRGEGQERALRRAYEDAGFAPHTVGLVEAHGTGTVAGDTTEVTTIVRFFNSHADAHTAAHAAGHGDEAAGAQIALGSVKSQIGHTKASAGAAGLIKTALALHHKILPPTLNVTTPNPKFGLESSPFYVNTKARPWIHTGDAPRRAGISSFGFGGTNFHVVMEEYAPQPGRDHAGAYRVGHTPQIVLIHGTDLAAQIADHRAHLAGEGADAHFLNLARSGQHTPPPTAPRLGFVAATAEEAASLLATAAELLAARPDADEWQHPKGIFYRRAALDTAGRVVALFAGQGSQYVEMGRELALNFPEVRAGFAAVDAVMGAPGALSGVVFPPPAFSVEAKAAQDAALQDTRFAQPAIGALSAGMFALFRNAGFAPAFTAGHSFGELTALWAAGVLDDAAYMRLIVARGAAMAAPDDPAFEAGTMLAVTGDAARVEAVLAGVPGAAVANRNSRTQVVVAGSREAVARADAALKAAGLKTTPLTVSAAFHTPLVGHAQAPFAQAIARERFNPARVPVYSNTTGRAYASDPAAMAETLAGHMLKPVSFTEEIENLYAAGGSVFVEFGPRSVLTNLVRDILGDRPHIAIALNPSRNKDSDRQMREAFVQLQVLGLPLSALDRYAAAPAQADAPKKKSLNVKLNGANYVSEKTRAAYQQALAQPIPGLAAPKAAPAPAPASAPAPTAALSAAVPAPALASAPASAPAPETAAPVPSIPPAQHTPEGEEDMTSILALLETSLAHLRDHQRDSLRVQEQFAQSQAEYFRIFFELTQQQQAQNNPQAAEAFANNMLRFHAYQSETLRMHEQYMAHNTHIAQELLATIREQFAAVAGRAPVGQAAPAPAVQRPAAPPPAASAPQPGYSNGHAAPPPAPPPPAPPAPPVFAAPPPAPPAPPVFAAPPPPAPPVFAAPPPAPPAPPVFAAPPPPAPPVFAAPVAAAPAPPVAVAPAPVAAAPAAPAPAAAAAPAGGLSIDVLSNAMLRIVADKTGYPVEMLELGMDMEADLGIDSIKRVEILGAMREEFKDLPQFSPEALGELRTLGQIVGYMQAQSAGNSTPAPAPAPVAVAAPAPAPVAAAPAPSAPVAAAPASAGGLSIDVLSNAMLRIVADKTGYPVEMLELGMDMEADLGIDSIKRVEILGAMREEFKDLPQFSPEALGELRTLGQIVGYMQEASRSAVPLA